MSQPKTSSNQLNNNQFFNRKKIIGIVIWTIVLIVLIALVLKFILDLDFRSFVNNLKLINNQNDHFLLSAILLSVFYFCFAIYARIFNYAIKLKKELKNKVRWYEWLNFSVVGTFLQIITPFSIGSEPYFVWWLSRKGVNKQKIGSVVGINLMTWSLVQTIVTWPSFIVYSINHATEINNGQITLIYYLMLLGLFVDILMMCLIFSINYSRHIHVIISRFTNYCRKWLKLEYLTKNQIEEKYVLNSLYKKAFKKELLQWSSLVIMFNHLIMALLTYVIFVLFYFSFNHVSTNRWPTIFNIVNIATTANNFVPIPNTEGTLQLTLQNLLNTTEKNDIASTIFGWRFFTSYASFIFGLGWISVLGLKTIIKQIMLKKTKKPNKALFV
ncbi:Lysylphosphatidylglycerol synthase / glycosyltransferase family protein [[Mycoplasma] cavipharyngis]|uniref:lysylphosphatidylglycerol synthase domain-containing protein n=1 Tax=[Mycoplasma] cavipharyngis TaxID=92757 RepID=UPI0037044F2C